ncbi:SDR family oxidoreductase [Clostridium botulinum]|uniref:SDR family oxidoreductase n=2 Tax=Clostridium botulinum TaxID=1491 RepID=A0A846HZ09_CLOBO|nr:SDR family oxidoreductase [Clostridium botulinum]AJD27779.1 short chain dehydrogenase family protein [Clostridium botulinum CDC_297]ACQ52583.1 oxidoreductase, short chain dehydrogenase/reductase family protein [Clostridium botulinum Ba4 str. 657]AJE12576.1 short chain dehydrogenase family protein [Clostridium botulinum CDC_1436]APR00566.1 short chain dehydrogenase family protein [Clostridium botulinum]APU59416.1 short chain dehydrogenase family protein [Clostridium botulinum]
MVNLIGKVAIVTGGSRGIGRSIALELTKAGANVIINYNKNKEDALETLSLIKDLGGYGYVCKADVSDYDSSKKLIEFAINKFGKIDILVNNAGIAKIGLFIDMDENDWDNIINTNLKGVFNCSHNVIKYMLDKGEGTIINVSSMWGNIGASCEVIYSASKGGINAFTKALAKELGPNNIRVNAVAPGVINTDMNSCLCEEDMDNLKNEIPLMRLGEGEEVGKVVAFLSSKDSSYINGQIITIDGAMC